MSVQYILSPLFKSTVDPPRVYDSYWFSGHMVKVKVKLLVFVQMLSLSIFWSLRLKDAKKFWNLNEFYSELHNSHFAELSKLEDNVDNIISNHESNHPSSRTEVLYETLQTWRQKLLRKASVGDICEALSRVGCRRRIIRRIREKYKEIVESRVIRPPFRRAMSLTEGLMGEKVGPIQGKSLAELSAYIWPIIIRSAYEQCNLLGHVRYMLIICYALVVKMVGKSMFD